MLAGRWNFRLSPAKSPASSGRCPARVCRDGRNAGAHRRRALRHADPAVVCINPPRDFTITKPRRAAPYRATHALHKVETLAEYAEHLGIIRPKSSAVQDILINVTSFFATRKRSRCSDPRLPSIAAEHGSADAIRMWVVGCSTGEEAYSLAIVLCGVMEQEGRNWPVQIFRRI